MDDCFECRQGACADLCSSSSPRSTTFTSRWPPVVGLSSQHLLTMQAQRQTQSSTDRSFFSKPKNAKSGSSTPVTRTVVTTRVVTTHKTAGTSKLSGAMKEVARGGTPVLSRASHSATPPPETARKRKTPHDQSAAPPKVKKPRLSTSPSTSRASSLAPSTHLSVPLTRQSSLAPRGVGRTSRSASVAPLQPLPPVPRDLWIEEDGRLGPGFVSCEEVVKKLMPTYKACMYLSVSVEQIRQLSSTFADFTNPHDPNDKAFEPQPTHYPVVELEYPNTNAAERSVHSQHLQPHLVDLHSDLSFSFPRTRTITTPLCA